MGEEAGNDDVVGKSIAELSTAMAAGDTTAVDVVRACLQRIERVDGDINSVVEVNPDAVAIAAELDAERADERVRGPLHGIPIVLKENIDTADRMLTTAGSLALMDSMPTADSTTAARLRTAGAVILAKTGMSEWAFFRSSHGTSGWSARNGQVHNAHDPSRSPGGSSSGSGAAVAAGLAPVAIGTETDGSIVSPATYNGVVGLKPTVGLTSRAGVIPISRSQDTIGPLAASVADAAAVLTALAGRDPRDQATTDADDHATDYSAFARRNADHLAGARIGVARSFTGRSPEADEVFASALERLRTAGAILVENTTLEPSRELRRAERQVLMYEFKEDLRLYLATRTEGSPRTLSDVISFNQEHAAVELRYFGQDILERSDEKGPLTDDAYLEARALCVRVSREEGLDRALADDELDALVAPTANPATMIDLVNGDHSIAGSSTLAACAGYPLISVPAGFVHGLPVGITFMGTAWSEPTLIRLASAFEHAP